MNTEKINWVHLVLILIVILTFESCAQTLLEKASLIMKKDNKRNLFLLGGIILYSIVGFCYYIALTSNVPLGIVNVIWQASTIIIMTLISIFYFKQKITTKQIIGIIIVACGSLLVP